MNNPPGQALLRVNPPVGNQEPLLFPRLELEIFRNLNLEPEPEVPPIPEPRGGTRVRYNNLPRD